MSKFHAALGARIKLLRIKSGMSQREFAEAAHINPALASRIERGLQNMTLTLIARTAVALRIPIRRLFDGIPIEAAVLEPKPRSNARPVKAETAVDGHAVAVPSNRAGVRPAAKRLGKALPVPSAE